MGYLYVFALFISFFSLTCESLERSQSAQGYVSVEMSGQFGNQLFEIATAYAYALDHDLFLTVPDLANKQRDNIPNNAEKLFFPRISSSAVPRIAQHKWQEPSFNYFPIPAASDIELYGYFQSEKYFKHRKQELLQLFSAPEGYNDLILKKYPFLASNALVVGVQIRDYRPERPTGEYHPTLNRLYYAEAMSYFPENAIFIVSSNNIEYAKECTQGLRENIIYLLDSSNYIEDFYTLVLCKSFIIANSSFGWWAAWLSTASNKTVIAPSCWFSSPYNNEVMIKDLIPEEWLLIPNTK